MTEPLTIEHLDPSTLLVDQNSRQTRTNPGLVASIRDVGVLQPVIAVRTADGSIRIRYGHRRALAAIEAGQPTIPVLVVASETAGTKADVDRIVGQYSENTHRENLTAIEEAGVVAQLLDLGLTAAQVHKRTRIPRPAIDAARKVSKSEAAAAIAAQVPINLEQAAQIADFDTDPRAVAELTAAAAEGDGAFRHAIAELRDQRADAESKARARVELEAAGFTVLDDRPDWSNILYSLRSPDGQTLTEDTHKDCPGHVAWLRQGWKNGESTWTPDWYCTDPRANGHQRGTSGGKTTDAETEAAERRRVIAGNKAWRIAETVRREWLTTSLLARKTPPDGALRFILESIARADTAIHSALTDHHRMAAQLLAFAEADQPYDSGTTFGYARLDAIVQTLSRAGDGRGQVLGLGLITGAYEAATDVSTWRTPASHSDIARYLIALASWGHTLAPIEQAVADGKDYEVTT